MNAALQGLYTYFSKRALVANNTRSPRKEKHVRNKTSSSYRYRLEMCKKSMDETKEEFRFHNEQQDHDNEKMADIIKKLTNIRFEEENFESVTQFLQESIGSLGKLQKQWSRLVVFFSKSNIQDKMLNA